MLLSVSNFLPPLVAAAQNIGLFGAVVVVLVALVTEGAQR